ncbi:hypothetical protein NP233_g9050 [Leucocoprinus birnbaumii]|uniref:Protein kinase domain-containing protein n=1 Tax=Leucocoprinus birnbaumii TaxID=56174 RepID=A0AAD5VLG3_9AGAR|nr:hypothetical protein NP233_g9050 [Leucocoprinus birnbaumii]
MTSQLSQGVHSVAPEAPNESDVFAVLCHLVSRIDAEDRMQEVIEKAQELERENLQLLVDCLSMSLDRNAAPLKCRSYVWRSLIKIALTANVLAQNHILDLAYLVRETGLPPGIYNVSGKATMRVKVLRKIENSQPNYSKAIISWIHISHPNIIPVYSIFPDDGQSLSLVSPEITHNNICAYIREHPRVPRMALVSDIANGLSFLHDHGIVHGGLYPDCVLVSVEGRAMIANTSISADLEDSDSLPVRYSAPEFLGEHENVQPTEASDVWSLASLSYEILSDKRPFFQIAKEVRVLGAISQGSKPIRPGIDGADGDEINDAIWQTLLMCWKFEPSERPPCLKVYQVVVGMGTKDERPVAKPMMVPDALKRSTLDLERPRSNLTRVLGSEAASSLRAPEHLRDSLLRLISDTNKLEAAAAVVLKLKLDETQCLVDFLDLLLEDLAVDWLSSNRKAVRNLLSIIIMSTPVIPKHYILNGVQYDAQKPLAVGAFGKAYEGRGLNVRINVWSDPGSRKSLLKFMSDWSHISHQNILQFHGVFQDDIGGGSQHLCVVTPLWRNGNLRDYAPTLPQEKRIHLLLDVAVALNHMHTEVNYSLSGSVLTTEKVLVSDQGRSALAIFGTQYIFTDDWAKKPTYRLRFTSPDKTKSKEADMWSFGCICYEVLSGKPPYYQYTEDAEIQAAVSGGQIPKRPTDSDEGAEMIDDDTWELIEQCCSADWWCRPRASTAMELIANIMKGEDGRPPAEQLPDASILTLRLRTEVNFPDIEALLGRIQVELLRDPLSKLLESRIKDVTAAALELLSDDIRTLVDFLDLTLKDYLLKSDERNRVLALLSKLSSSTQTFPQCYEIKGIQYRPVPIAEGGFGTVHRGSDLSMCVKVMSRVDTNALTVALICMIIPKILDVINGLGYLHVYGIIHSDLKGQNVLISDEGRGLLTDFGASHIATATAAPTTSTISKTFRYAAPELVEDGAQPSKASDVWAFGCLCYQELPKRPSPIEINNDDENNWDVEVDDNWDPIDDQAWTLITNCCTPEPGDRLKVPAVQELIADMKVWDDRPVMKAAPGADIFKLHFKPDIDLDSVGEILAELQAKLAPSSSQELDFNLHFNQMQ